MLNQGEETIKIEISLREPLLTLVSDGAARTVLRVHSQTTRWWRQLQFAVSDKSEALTEKFRAALSRREPAIRDFFDIDYAVRRLTAPRLD